MDSVLTVNGIEYKIIKLLGHGKGGYSYLAERDGRLVVVKKIHHEPCDYYTFGNKIEAERHDYRKLVSAGIPTPEMLDIDTTAEIVVKRYIDGLTVYEALKNWQSVDHLLPQIKQIAFVAKRAGLNIDYFPTNFVISGGKLFYVDYECNEYSDQWNFDNWGVRYWSMTPELSEYIKNH